MKRAIPIIVLALAVSLTAVAHAGERSLTVLLAGGDEANQIEIELNPDGRTYTIDSIVSLEVGGDVCWHPTGVDNELVCEAAAIAGFEVNAGAGDDSVSVAANVPIPVTLRGGPGDDKLVGGAAADKLTGGSGNDLLVGHGDADSLYGGPGDDRLLGGPGDDRLVGGSGEDTLLGGTGLNTLVARPALR
jgi:Ca2+-binding RTX toxin-like protein